MKRFKMGRCENGVAKSDGLHNSKNPWSFAHLFYGTKGLLFAQNFLKHNARSDFTESFCDRCALCVSKDLTTKTRKTRRSHKEKCVFKESLLKKLRVLREVFVNFVLKNNAQNAPLTRRISCANLSPKGEEGKLDLTGSRCDAVRFVFQKISPRRHEKHEEATKKNAFLKNPF